MQSGMYPGFRLEVVVGILVCGMVVYVVMVCAWNASVHISIIVSCQPSASCLTACSVYICNVSSMIACCRTRRFTLSVV